MAGAWHMLARMAKYDASTAECLVYTFKDGLLSKLGHDLKIRVTRFSLEIDDDSKAVTVEVDAKSLRVDCAVKNGQDDPYSLTEVDKSKIAGQIVTDVLEASQYPLVRFASTSVTQRDDGGYDIAGDLSLHGVTRPMNARTHIDDGRQVAEVVIHQPDHGIKPYKAVMGTLKVKPDVRVRLSVPA